MSCSCCSPGLPTKSFEPFIVADKLERYCRLDNTKSRFKNPIVRPEEQESSLQKLPIEVYHNVLQYLDVGTLTSMRSVSQYTRSSVDSLHPYKELYEFAPQALRACISTEMAPHIPLLRLHNALITLECHYCKQSNTTENTFGTYLSLWEGYRICAFCIRNSPFLKPAELNHLILLCSTKKSSLPATSLSSIPKLKTLRGHYSTTKAEATGPEIKRTTLMLTNFITPGKTLSDKEARVLSSDTSNSNTILHHPFVRSSDESDISPSIGYTPPETDRLISLRYTTAIALPFLNSTKKFSRGILCQECCLRMRYTERIWKAEQRHRRQTSQNPTASNAKRARINNLRLQASKYYIVAHELEGNENGKGKRKAGEDEMSIQQHYRDVHSKNVGWEVGPHEEGWRDRHKGPPLPLLRKEDFWQPPPKRVKVSEESEFSQGTVIEVKAVGN